MKIHPSLFVAALLTSAACSLGDSTEPLPAGGIHALFVGNSLTYVNDLPSTVEAIALSAGDTVRTMGAVGSNLALIDHLTGASDARFRLMDGGWNFVILQQGPTPAGICRDSLVLWTKMYSPLLQGAKLAVLMPWAGDTHRDLFDEVRVSFQAAAHGSDASFMPAGEAWRAAWRADPSLQLYGEDGFHPSRLGTFLTALVVYERVTGHDARNLPPRAYSVGQPFNLPTETIRLLQKAAHDANAAFPANSAPTAEELARPSIYQSTHPGTC